MNVDDELKGALRFFSEAERLKNVLRSSHTSGGRRESTAEHTWRLCLMAVVLADRFGNIDLAKLLKICIVHDLGEALNGDIPAVDQRASTHKADQERADLHALTAPLAQSRRDEILSLWEEYEAGSSPEAVLAKGLDKLETILQHNQGSNPDDFDYGFNLSYGIRHTSAHPVLVALRTAIDEQTRARLSSRKPEDL